MPSQIPPLPASIESLVLAFCAKHGMPKTRFGELAVKDASFVSDLAAGREPRRKTVQRVLDFMEKHEGAAQP